MFSDSSLENIQHISTISPEQYTSVVTLCHVPSGCVVQWICWSVINCSHLRSHPDNSWVSNCNAAGCVFWAVTSVLVHPHSSYNLEVFWGKRLVTPLLFPEGCEHVKHNFWLKSFLRRCRILLALDWGWSRWIFSKPLFAQGSCTHLIQVFEPRKVFEPGAVKVLCVFLSTASLGARWGEVRSHLQNINKSLCFPVGFYQFFTGEWGFSPMFPTHPQSWVVVPGSQQPLGWFRGISASPGAFPSEETESFLREHSLACPTAAPNATAIPERVGTGVRACGDKRDFKSTASPKAAPWNWAFITDISQGNYVNYKLLK